MACKTISECVTVFLTPLGQVADFDIRKLTCGADMADNERARSLIIGHSIDELADESVTLAVDDEALSAEERCDLDKILFAVSEVAKAYLGKQSDCILEGMDVNDDGTTLIGILPIQLPASNTPHHCTGDCHS